jgi:GTP-binding protein Era
MQKKSGYVAILGLPNSGKSTLLNAILGQELSIVTPKPQTTRNKITGIYTEDNVQMVFTDTPGILDPKYKLQFFMRKETESSFAEADILLFVLDITKYNSEVLSEVFNKYRKPFSSHKLILVLNKIDLVNKDEVLLAIREINGKMGLDEIVPLSALTSFNITELIKTITKYLPESEFYYDDDIITSQPEKFFVSEIIREQAMMIYREEIPFAICVDIEEFREQPNRKVYIKANILLEKESQKAIVIGTNGLMVKELGMKARKRTESFLHHPVFLELHVKVKKDWKNDEKFLKRTFKLLSSPTA